MTDEKHVQYIFCTLGTGGNTGNGIFLIILSIIPIFLYFKNEFILLAFLKLRKQDFSGATAWLAKIKNPETALVRKQQGYYNYLHGIMLSQTNLIQSEKYFKKAIELGLSMDMDLDRKSTRLNSSHRNTSRMPSSA